MSAGRMVEHAAGACKRTRQSVAQCPHESKHQILLDHLASNGSWVNHRGVQALALDDWWRWELPTVPNTVTTTEALSMLRGQWLLVVGDSRARLVFASLMNLLGGVPLGTLMPKSFPNYRMPLQNAACRASTVHDAYNHCKQLVRGECVEDDMTAASNRNAVRPGCILDVQFEDADVGHGHPNSIERGVRLTFLWHAMGPMAQVLKRLASVLKPREGAGGGGTISVPLADSPSRQPWRMADVRHAQQVWKDTCRV